MTLLDQPFVLTQELTWAEVQAPVRVVDVDDDGVELHVTTTSGDGAASAYVLLRRDGRPVGHVLVPADIIDNEVALRALIERASLGRDATLGAVATSDLVSVIIPTRNRPDDLRLCLASLREQTHASFEVLVVDNDPASGVTAPIVAEAGDPRFRYVAEARQGSSTARNTGIGVAAGSIIAFTDDDVVVDPRWLETLAAVFAESDDVQCVTGLVVPAQLDTQAQVLFEQYGGFGKGYRRLVHTLVAPPLDDPSYPFRAGAFGSGNNMAFRADYLAASGGWDERLGAGSIARAGADIDALLGVVLAGHQLVYEPRAFVRHKHRRGMDELARQLHNYGSGMSAIITKRMVEPGCRRRLLSALPTLVAGQQITTQNERGASWPAELTRTERHGLALGPVRFARSWAAVARQSTANRMFRTAFALLCNAGLTALMGVGFWALAAHWFTSAQVAQGSTFVFALMAIGSVGQLNLGGAISRYVPRLGRHAGPFIVRSYAVAAGVSATVALGVALVIPHLSDRLQFLGGSASNVTLLVAAAAVWSVFALQDYVLTSVGGAAWVPVENVIYSAVKLGLVVALANQAHGIALAWVLPAAAALIPMNAFVVRRLLLRSAPGTVTTVERRDVAGFVGADWLGGVLAWSQSLVLPLMLVVAIGAAKAAPFSLVLLLVTTFDYGVLGFSTSLTVEGSRNIERLPVLTRRLLRVAGSLVVVAVALLIVFAPAVLSMFGHGYAVHGTPALRLLALGSLARAAVSCAIAVARVRRDVVAIVRLQAVGSVTAVALAASLLHPLGMTGLALGYACGWFVAAGTAVPVLRRAVRWCPQ
jgi:GT2 family glycosyltransferase/O-antigen/teichoic acid export membrane protein